MTRSTDGGTVSKVRSPEEAAAAVEVTDDAELARLAHDWRRLPVLAIDTEFLRERTFYPALGLIQLSDGDRVVLVDPLAIDDLEPLAKILADPSVVKVMHSASEDLEVLYHRFGKFPTPLFDTQIAAAFAGYGASLGYGRLVEELFGIELPKGETRSAWLKRPLRPAQKRYAALDVAYLLPAYERLRAELEALGREGWVLEEIEKLADAKRFLPEPERVYRGARHPKMSRRELGVLREVSAWRESEARRRDLPRGFVLPQPAVAEIARQQPRSRDELEALRSLRPVDRRRHGREIVRLVRRALELPEDELPERVDGRVDLTRHRSKVERLRRAIARRAEALAIPAELLASRRTAEALVRRRLEGKEPLPASMPPWRRQVLAEILDEMPDWK